MVSNNQSGVQIGRSTGNLLEGNIIGLDSAGLLNLSNNGFGVLIGTGANSNTIGGTAAGAFNVISANNGPGVEIIQAGSEVVADNQVIDNRIGTDLTGTRIVGTDGKALGNATDGILDINSQGNTISSNLISGNGSSGIVLTGLGASRNLLTGNLVGTDIDDIVSLGNFANGISISNAPENQVNSNVISGNELVGVNIDGSGAIGNILTGNEIGCNASGTLALSNLNNGVVIANASGNFIGLPNTLNPDGTIANRLGNLISANSGVGVQILGVDSTGNLIQGNQIGTDFSGLQRLGNLQGGVLVNDSSSNTIGGLTSGTGNIISANLGAGVQILASTSTAAGNQVLGNIIGLAVTGGFSTAPLGNSGDGVFVLNASQTIIEGNLISKNADSGIDIVNGVGTEVVDNRIGTDHLGILAFGNSGDGILLNGSSSTTIGGLTAGSANVISGNAGDGIGLTSGSYGNLIVKNQIGTDPTGETGVDASGPDGIYGTADDIKVGNSQDGIRFSNVGPFNALFNNMVSANGGAGVEIAGASFPVILQGNVIGLTPNEQPNWATSTVFI